MPERVAVGQRLGVGHVESGRAKLARSECFAQRGLIDHAAARDVHEQRPALARRERARIEEMPRLGRQRDRDGDGIRRPEDLVQFAERMEFIDERIAYGRARNGNDARSERLRALRDLLADASVADDGQRGAFERRSPRRS